MRLECEMSFKKRCFFLQGWQSGTAPRAQFWPGPGWLSGAAGSHRPTSPTAAPPSLGRPCSVRRLPTSSRICGAWGWNTRPPPPTCRSRPSTCTRCTTGGHSKTYTTISKSCLGCPYFNSLSGLRGGFFWVLLRVFLLVLS